MAENIRRCDYCGKTFEVHNFTYHPVIMPRQDNSGLFRDNEPDGLRTDINTVRLDVCWNCLSAIRAFLKSLQAK